MPRANRRRRDERPLSMQGVHGSTERVTWGGRAWVVRRLSGATSLRDYRCPGCHHTITAGTAHLVVWPDDGLGGIDDRRHWHGSCWRARPGR